MRRVPYKWPALSVATVGVFMSVLDSTIVNIALPSLIAGFHANVADVQWVVTAYLLALGASIPLAAYLADRLGMRPVYAGLVAAFTGASVLCALAPNLPALIAFRVLQGMAGGGLMPLSLAITFRAWPPREIGKAMGLSGVPILLAPALGPTLGGYLVEYASWRFIFFINVPVGVLGVFLALRWLQDYRAPQKSSLDVPGLALCTTGTVSLLYGVSEAANSGWGAPRVLIALAAGAALLLAFLRVELRRRAPLLEVRLYARSAFLMPALVSNLGSVAMFGGTLLLPLYLQDLHGYTPFIAGMIMLPQALASAVSMPLGGRLYDRAGARMPTLIGFIILIVATVLLMRLDATTAWPAIAIILTVRGLGSGMGMMPTMSAAMSAGGEVSEAQVSALLNISRQIFSALGVALLATILQARITAHAPAGVSVSTLAGQTPAVLHSVALGFHEAFAVLVLATLPVLALAVLLRDTRPLDKTEPAAVSMEPAL